METLRAVGPSDCGIPDDKRANSLAAAAHSQTPRIVIDRFVEPGAIIRDSVLSHHPNVDAAHGFHLFLLRGNSPSKPLTRAFIAFTQSLCAHENELCIASRRLHSVFVRHLKEIGAVFNLLWSCFLYAPQTYVLRHAIPGTGRSSSCRNYSLIRQGNQDQLNLYMEHRQCYLRRQAFKFNCSNTVPKLRSLSV